jgi:ABC-2 type transport system ATP-binding protein
MRLMSILEGYRSRDGGDVSVLGEDPAQAGSRWRARIGLVLQSCTMPAELTVRELVELYAGYYPHPRPAAETIELVGLTDKRDARLSSARQRSPASPSRWSRGSPVLKRRRPRPT